MDAGWVCGHELRRKSTARDCGRPPPAQVPPTSPAACRPLQLPGRCGGERSKRAPS